MTDSDDDIDLRDFAYMPLHISRLQKSKAWLACKRDPSLAFYMMNLWMRSWHEVPCGSLEDDDDVLADAAMCSVDKWEKVKEKVLRGWEKRGDRLFHAVVTEIAGDSWEKKKNQRRRTSSATEARIRNRDEQRNVQRDVGPNPHDVGRDDQRDVDVTSTKGREEKRREGIVPPYPPETAGAAHGAAGGDDDYNDLNEAVLGRVIVPVDPPLPLLRAAVRPAAAPPAKRACRLPEDWQPRQDEIDLAAQRGVNVKAAAEEFRNYWWSRAKDATKLNWDLTFRNRLIELAEQGKFRVAPNNGRPASNVSSGWDFGVMGEAL